MKRLMVTLLFAFLASYLCAAGSGFDAFLKSTNYRSFMETAKNNLEKLFLEDMMEFTPPGRDLYIKAWKAVQDNQAPLTSGSMYFLAYTTRVDQLKKATETFDNLVYDQLVKFKDATAKQLYREALTKIRLAQESL